MNTTDCWDKLQNFGAFRRPEGLLTNEDWKEIEKIRDHYRDQPLPEGVKPY